MKVRFEISKEFLIVIFSFFGFLAGIGSLHAGDLFEPFPVAGAEKWRAVRYPYSLERSMLGTDPNAVATNLTAECRQSLTEWHTLGKRLHSDLIEKNIDDNYFEKKVSGGWLFHFTESTAVKKISAENKPLMLFDYIRTKNNPDLWDTLFYVADDHLSSKKYGPIEIGIKLRRGLSVLVEKDYGNAQEPDGLPRASHSGISSKKSSTCSLCEKQIRCSRRRISYSLLFGGRGNGG